MLITPDNVGIEQAVSGLGEALSNAGAYQFISNWSSPWSSAASGLLGNAKPAVGAYSLLDSQLNMDDKDVARLQDRITASEDRGNLRLEVAMAKIDGKLDGLVTSVGEIKVQAKETRNLIIASAVATFIGVLTMLIGLKQIWIGGVQVGQVSQQQTAQTQPTSSSH